MATFFKRWRRKIGILPLVLTLVLTVAWIRSYDFADSYGFYVDGHPGRGFVLSITSIHGSAVVMQTFDVGGIKTPVSAFCGTWSMRRTLNDGQIDPICVRWRFCGFEFERSEYFTDFNSTNIKSRSIAIQYWLLALPFTIAAAWLLLSKPIPTPARIENTLRSRD